MITRAVEMFVGVYEGDARTWYETTVEIPADTPAEKVEAVATRALARQLEGADESVAFFGVMPVWAPVEPPAVRPDLTAAGR